MPSERLTALLDDKTRWAAAAAMWVISDRPPWWRMNAPLSYVMQAPYWAEELDREAWLKDVKQRLGLVTQDEIGSHELTRRLEEAGRDPWPDLSRSPWLPYLPTN